MTRMRVYRCVNGSVGPSLSLPFVMPCLLPYDEKHRVISKQKPLCSFLTFIIPFLDRSCQIKLHIQRYLASQIRTEPFIQEAGSKLRLMILENQQGRLLHVGSVKQIPC